MPQKIQCDNDADWVSNPKGFLIAWGIPVISMTLSGFLDPSIRIFVWVVALIWMGGACMINARHCNRTHCKFTGPFFLLMAIPVGLHGFGVFSLGPNGWWWLAAGILIGTVILWWGSEAFWGKYRN